MNDLLEDLEKAVNQAFDTMFEVSDQVADRVDGVLNQALDELDRVVEPWATTMGASFMTWLEEVSAPITHVVDPLVQDHPKCVGCRHYHGQTYGQSMLVCGMHPFGPEAELEKCPDWQSIF
jgi:hypothetical protein